MARGPLQVISKGLALPHRVVRLRRLGARDEDLSELSKQKG